MLKKIDNIYSFRDFCKNLADWLMADGIAYRYSRLPTSRSGALLDNNTPPPPPP
jgi:hypothetical protein